MKRKGEDLGGDLQSFGPGWRVEFRPLEVQLTDFENAAFAILVVLLSRLIVATGLDFYIPMSKVEENMRRAQLKDAVRTQKFWVRKGAFAGKRITSRMTQQSSISAVSGREYAFPAPEEVELEEATLDEVTTLRPTMGHVDARLH